MSLVDLIARADERGLAVSGLACLDRCLPLLGGDDEVLRPLWATLGDADDTGDWGERLAHAREALATPGEPALGELALGESALGQSAFGESAPGKSAFGESAPGRSGEDEPARLARRMLAAAPADRCAAEVRAWADGCSLAALHIHRLLDPSDADHASPSVDAGREGRTEGMSPLVAAELRRQVTVLEVLAGHGGAGLRRALEVSTEGRRVLRAVVSRRARHG
jgi:hypothetical protein